MSELATTKESLAKTEQELEKAMKLIEELRTRETPKELRIHNPPEFSGKRSEFAAFVDAFRMYLNLNERLYDNDDKKITFVLSYFTKGEAAQWKSSFIAEKTNDNDEIKLGTWKAFNERLEADFREIDEKGDALFRLQNLEQQGRTAEDLASEFKILAYKAKLINSNKTTDSEDIGNRLLQEYFRNALKPALLRRILDTDHPPTTLDALIAKAIFWDNQWRRTKRAMAGRPIEGKIRNVRRIPFENRLPPETEEVKTRVMAMTLQQREQLRREGKCYFCQKQGHRVFECPTAPRKPKWEPRSNPPDPPSTWRKANGSAQKKNLKWDAKKATAHVRKLGSNLDEEDLEEFGQIVEESFQQED
jgi:hypothetical protein